MLLYALGVISGIVLIMIALGGWIISAAYQIKEKQASGQARQALHRANPGRAPVESNATRGVNLWPFDSARTA